MGGSDLALAIAAASAYLIAVFSPFIVAVALAVRGTSQTPRRGAFVLVATALAYGAALFAWLLVAVPVRLFVAYVYPLLALTYSSTRSWEALWVLPLYRIGEFPQYILASPCSLWRVLSSYTYGVTGPIDRSGRGLTTRSTGRCPAVSFGTAGSAG